MADLKTDEFGLVEQGEAALGLDAPPPKVSTKQELDALAPGAEFFDPTGTKRTKPWQVKDADSYRAVPEGGTFMDPTGTARTKPTYEPIDFWPQTLIDMTRGNERQIEAILKGEFGEENVKREPLTNDFYIERDGKKLKPGKASIKRALAETAALAVPVSLGTTGALLGATGGSIVPAAGTAAGGVGGAVVGGAAGEAFNQSVLALAGYPSTLTEYLGTVGKEALWSGGGQMLGGIAGRGVEKAVNAGGVLKGVFGDSGRWLGKLLGAQPEETAQAARLAEEGAMVPPSSWLKEAPYLKKVVEEFDPVFRQQNVLQKSAKAYYDKTAPEVMEAAGVKPPGGSLTEATAPVSVEPLGATMLLSAQKRAAAADTKLDAAVNQARETFLKRGVTPDDIKAREATLASLRNAEAEARTAAQGIVDNGFKSIGADVDNAIKTAGAGGNPGDLIRLADDKIRALRAGVGARATKLYEAADVAAGDLKPDVTMLRAQADEFLAQVPEDFKTKYPSIIRAISEMEKDVTFGQIHKLRSMLRQDVDTYDLTPGVRNGAYKFFIGKINEVLFDKEAPPALREAADLLAKADGFYAKNIAKFKSESLKWAVGQLEAGVPADAATLAEKFMRPGQGEEIRMARRVVGKPLWGAVQAADTQQMLEQSKTLVPGEVDGMEFVRQVLQRDRDGILAAAYDTKTAETLRAQARNVLSLEGKLPIATEGGDTLQTVLRRADSIAQEIKALADKDPVKLLNDEMRQFQKAERTVRAETGRARRADPLHFLEQPSAGAIESANKILNKPDLILAVARQNGEASPEFEMLRQVWTQRLLQRSIASTPGLAGEFAEKIPPEIQQLMFPGVSLDAAQQLAKDMAFLLPQSVTDFGGSIAAASRVLNPITSLPILKGAVKLIPGANTAARAMHGWYYSTMTWATTHPAFVRYIAAGLKGNDQMRDLARREFQESFGNWVRRGGGAAGAGVGAASAPGYTDPPDQPPPVSRPQAPPQKPWREVYQERFGR